MDVELVTDVEAVQGFVGGWDALAGRVQLPRASGTMVAAWARRMMDPVSELRVWIATEGADVVAVLPFVSEPMARGRVRLIPPATDMMFGVVPVVDPDHADDAIAAVAAAIAARAEPVDMASLYWLPHGSPWSTALHGVFPEPEWVAIKTTDYHAWYTELGKSQDDWLQTRGGEFRRTVRRRARRLEEQGFRVVTIVDPAEIKARLSRVQSLYQSRKMERGGEGYRFDDGMIGAIEDVLETSGTVQLRLSVVERGELLVGASLAVRAEARMSCWLTGFDSEWSRLGPGIAALLEALDAGGRSGCLVADLGVGDQSYKDEFQDAAFPLESLTWCRPRLARLLQLGAPGTSQQGQTQGASGGG
ncbi:MAG TPA: GNAT family N-acetyltransferase [Acidimicrobiales bacterium]|jgi:CelD/BcsL family acetyltransferase involved in cellulose biosynthesis|nr:GNAT family N-acetyltransferase [Acidimicrobiales bacterium]